MSVTDAKKAAGCQEFTDLCHLVITHPTYLFKIFHHTEALPKRLSSPNASIGDPVFSASKIWIPGHGGLYRSDADVFVSHHPGMGRFGGRTGENRGGSLSAHDAVSAG